MCKRKKPQLRLVVNNESVLFRSGLNWHLLDAKLPAAQDLYLVRPQVRDNAIPHRDGLSGAAKSIGKGLMGAAKMVNNFFKIDASAQVDSLRQDTSVSVLPRSVKSLTRKGADRVRKLAYMSKRGPKDPWSVERGKKMRDARERLGYSQEQVAKLIDLTDGEHLTRESISQYESGSIKEIDPPLVRQFSVVLGMPISEISRLVTEARDEGADLRVSTIARSIAYKFDRFPPVLQMQIRQFISVYEDSITFEQSKKRAKKSAKG